MAKVTLITMGALLLGTAGFGYLVALAIQPIAQHTSRTATEPSGLIIRDWTAQSKAEVLKAGQKALIHFTGDACLTCTTQWLQIDKQALARAAVENGVLVYEINMEVGGDNNFMAQEMQQFRLGGLPGYITLDSKGSVTMLEAGPFGLTPPDLVKAVKELK